MIIAIDGPAGAGKSTIAKILAQKLQFIYLDTGAMYRALTLKALDQGLDIKDAAALVEVARRTTIDLVNQPQGNLAVFLDGRDVSAEIRQPRITASVSDLAKIKGVREVMLALQRKLGQAQNTVLDGRDIGTVVFPQAEKKFYLDADFQERVRRRYKELRELAQEITLADVQKDLHNRDTIDSTREYAPLKQAADAFYIDTTLMSIEQVVDKLFQTVVKE